MAKVFSYISATGLRSGDSVEPAFVCNVARSLWPDRTAEHYVRVATRQPLSNAHCSDPRRGKIHLKVEMPAVLGLLFFKSLASQSRREHGPAKLALVFTTATLLALDECRR